MPGHVAIIFFEGGSVPSKVESFVRALLPKLNGLHSIPLYKRDVPHATVGAFVLEAVRVILDFFPDLTARYTCTCTGPFGISPYDRRLSASVRGMVDDF